MSDQRYDIEELAYQATLDELRKVRADELSAHDDERRAWRDDEIDEEDRE